MIDWGRAGASGLILVFGLVLAWGSFEEVWGFLRTAPPMTFGNVFEAAAFIGFIYLGLALAWSAIRFYAESRHQ